MRRGAIIGFGEVARHGHLPGYQNSSAAGIVAIVDPAEERRALATVPVFSSLAELAASGLRIDFVDICTPPAFHGPAILEALSSGWDVLCEKPLLLEREEIEQVRAAARAAGRAVVPVHNWKYAPIVRQAKALLDAGKIGALRAVEIETLRIQDCAAADPAQPNWRLNPAIAGGGILMDHGWHAIYLAEYFFEEAAIAVRASLQRAAPNEVENEARLRLNFPRGSADIFLTWRSDRRRNAMRLIGEHGEIVIDDNALKTRSGSVAFEKALSSGSHHADWFEAMLPDVLESFRDPGKARASFEEAARCLQLISAAYESA